MVAYQDLEMGDLVLITHRVGGQERELLCTFVRCSALNGVMEPLQLLVIPHQESDFIFIGFRDRRSPMIALATLGVIGVRVLSRCRGALG